MTWRSRAVGLLLLTQLTACGSSDGPNPDGPLQTYPDRNEVCMQQTADGLLTFGIDVTKNTSDRSLTLQDVRLTKPEGMTIVGSKVMLVPAEGESSTVGARNGWPPTLGTNDKEGRITDAMLDRAPVLKGASVPVGKKDVSFVIGVRTKAGATTGPLRVRYTDSKGDRFVWNGNTSYRTSAKPCDY